ncbi:reprolysin-like metallopeptidase [Chryseobacterium sp.]|jgi:hypothetical protein|uniref:reprolysin-like metallopeptidase n=1 Tax=Chryseobacterium sp. TaxID=1871047 RepID=UPI002845C9FA|nr:zinc-dependent metalloprotease family protein [Chryseobacterium sp.]MDR3025299.1 M12 family metallo-peptidase [Chryseobacterium sp.]
MKKQLFMIGMLLTGSISFAQTDHLWTENTQKPPSEILENKKEISNPRVFKLDIDGLKNALSGARQKQSNGKQSAVIISLPNEEGIMKNFRVRENSNFDPALAAKYPDIKSYVGENTNDANSTVYFSISSLGLSSMEVNDNNSAVFIEPYTQDLSSYIIYKATDRKNGLNTFECGVIDSAQKSKLNLTNITARPNADDAVLRTYRLAVSCTGEYAGYFGGTKANALAAINNTMTRVNAIFERDFSARMVLVANNDAILYTNYLTDPYSSAIISDSWAGQIQQTISSVIGEANYDIGHLFAGSGRGGNAGCIGCIGVDGEKGSAFTSAVGTAPSGDIFDLRVAHEMGHQFGANHTFTYADENTNVQMEPGAGSTIMSYAGTADQLNIQSSRDPFFHAISIQQVTNNIKAKTCSVNTPTGNSIPTAKAGADYTIPKGTPFMLTGQATDANGDALTYSWEEMDNTPSSLTGPYSMASATKAAGPTFRSWIPSTSPTRYFPRMASILSGATTTEGTQVTAEALPSVARKLKFRFTVRDNRAGGSGNNSDDAVITVNGTAGPFSITSQNVIPTAQNSALTLAGGSSQTVTWDVAGTTANGINTANVDILWSGDNGNTWTTLLAATPNDGSQAVTIPNVSTIKGRLMVKGTNHIFFDVNNANITVNVSGSSDVTAPKAPVLTASGTKPTSTKLSWSGATDNVGVTSYVVYRGGTYLGSTTSTSYTVNNLTPSTTYSFTVKSKDAAGNLSVTSNTAAVTTPATMVEPYCDVNSTFSDEVRFTNVKFGTINNSATFWGGYKDFTSLSTNVTKGATYPISITINTQTPADYYALDYFNAYIDFNQDGVFGSNEFVWGYKRRGTDATTVQGNIEIPSDALSGATRMRIVRVDNIYGQSCGINDGGQAVDYTVNITSSPTGKMVLTTDVKDQSLEDIKLYPNPVKDILNVTNVTSEEYIIFDMTGKILLSGKLERGTVNVSSLLKGIYMIQIGDKAKKFIKQ